jgi:hypothetical protein
LAQIASEVRLAEVRPDEVRSVEVRPAEVRPAEVHLGEVRSVKVRPAEVRHAEVRPPVDEANVWSEGGHPPSAPDTDTLVELFQVVWISHLRRLPMDHRLAAKIGVILYKVLLLTANSILYVDSPSYDILRIVSIVKSVGTIGRGNGFEFFLSRGVPYPDTWF